MKLLKISFYIVGLLIFIFVFTVAGLLYFIDPNKLKPVIAEEIKKQTGYELVIDGKLSWSLFPRLSIKIDSMSLQAPTEALPFLELHGAKLATELSALFRGNEKLIGHISIDRLRFMNMHATKGEANLSWKDNVLTIDAIYAALYKGSLSGSVHGRDLMSLPEWDWNAQLKQVEMHSLLQDINGPNSKVKVSGTAQVNMQARTRGKAKKEILQNLNGQTTFSIMNGTVDGVDFNYLVQSADALLSKKVVPVPQSNQTTFQQMTGTAVIKNGVAETDNLSLISSAFLMNGKGYVNLNNQTLKLLIEIQPQKNLQNKWQVPVLVSGEIKNPDVRLDMPEVEKALAKQEIEKVKEKASEIIQKNVPGKAGQFLQKLIGN